MAEEPKNIGQLPDAPETIADDDYLVLFDSSASAPNKTVKMRWDDFLELLSTSMLNQTLAQTVRVLQIETTDSFIALQTLINTALANASVDQEDFYPAGKSIIQVNLTPLQSDGQISTIDNSLLIFAAADQKYVYPVLDALDTLKILGDGLFWNVELFYSS